MLDVSISAAMWRSVGLVWGHCRARCQECSWWQGSVLSQYFDCSSRHARKLKTWLSFLMFLPTDPYSLGMIELMSASLHRVKYERLSKPAKVLVHRVVLKEFRHYRADQDAVETYCSRDFMYVCPCPKFIFNYEDVLVSRACLICVMTKREMIIWLAEQLGLLIVSARDLDFVNRFERRSEYVWNIRCWNMSVLS